MQINMIKVAEKYWMKNITTKVEKGKQKKQENPRKTTGFSNFSIFIFM
jgi:hypothetical protein